MTTIREGTSDCKSVKTCKDCARTLPIENFYRNTNGTPKAVCKPCHRARTVAWAKKNPEKVREISKRYQTKNADKLRESGRKWREKNADISRPKAQERTRQWREKNREKHHSYVRKWNSENAGRVKENQQAWREENREKVNEHGRKYKKRHPEKVREYALRRRARMLGSQAERVDYAAILARYGYVCHICGDLISRADLQFDHIIPIAKGGPHSMANIRPAHALCNRRKSDKLLPTG